jgi:hypothetical protein
MIELKASDCFWGMTVMILGIALHCYTAGEFLASLLTTGLLTVLLALMLLSTFLAWHTGKASYYPDAGRAAQLGGAPLSHLRAREAWDHGIIARSVLLQNPAIIDRYRWQESRAPGASLSTLRHRLWTRVNQYSRHLWDK